MAIVLAGIRYGMWEGLVTALASGVLVDRADQALYQVKRQGRNWVVAWSA